MDSQQAYSELIAHARQTALLASCIELLGWDEETYLPAAGFENRARQIALLTGLLHERGADPRLGELLDAFGGCGGSDVHSVAAINVRELRRQYERVRRVPRRLAEEIARVAVLAQQAWAAALRADDYVVFRPWLERIVALKREEAEALGYATSAYDALLEEYEPGLRTADLSRLFGELRPPLTALAAELTDSGRKAPIEVLQGDFPVARQKAFCERAAGAVGFDFHGGRLDVAAHPSCCSIGRGDCRITTRYHPRRFGDALFSTMHEVGHALYEQGLDPDHAGTPVGEAPSVALHESQARLWENAVARSRPFWEHFFPLLRQAFPEALAGVGLDGFTFAVHHVEPTLSRVRADEVTYNLHIFIRFDLERALLGGDLQPAELPGAWNDAYRRDLGAAPETDAEGCLQDGHWAAGLFGYFPTYTLGNIFAAQLFTRARADLGDLDRRMARGDFGGLLDWLRRNVYLQGGRRRAAELVERVTGSPPAPGPLLRVLEEKYGAIYGIG